MREGPRPRNACLNGPCSGLRKRNFDGVPRAVVSYFDERVSADAAEKHIVKLGNPKGTMPDLRREAYRHCIDLRTMLDRGVYGLSEVPPPYRLWVTDRDMRRATWDSPLEMTGASGSALIARGWGRVQRAAVLERVRGMST